MRVKNSMCVAGCIGALLIVGCATEPPAPTDDYGPKLTHYGKNDLVDKGEITLPPGFSKEDMTELVMGVAFKASDKLPSNVAPGEEPLPVDPNMSVTLQTYMDKLKRFTMVALHGSDTENDLAAVAEYSEGKIELAEQEKPVKINVLLQCNVVCTKARTVVRGVGSQPDSEQLVYKVYLMATCKDLRKGTVLFSEPVVGRTRPHVVTMVNGRPRGGFDVKSQSSAIEKAAMNAIIELANKLGNRFPAGGHVIAVSRSGDSMTLDKGANEGVGMGQQCVIVMDDEGVNIPLALAEAYPETTESKAALKIYRWNETDKDAKEIMNEFKASPRGFFNANKNNLYAVCYGMALPPEWEQNATK